MFSLPDLRFVLCSRDLDIIPAQRIMGFLPTNQRGPKIRSHGWLCCVCLFMFVVLFLSFLIVCFLYTFFFTHLFFPAQATSSAVSVECTLSVGCICTASHALPGTALRWHNSPRCTCYQSWRTGHKLCVHSTEQYTCACFRPRPSLWNSLREFLPSRWHSLGSDFACSGVRLLHSLMDSRQQLEMARTE